MCKVQEFFYSANWHVSRPLVSDLNGAFIVVQINVAREATRAATISQYDFSTTSFALVLFRAFSK